MISNANLLKKRKKRRERRIGLLHLWQIMTGIFLYSPWREKTDIVKIYWGRSRRWRHVNLALSTYLQTSELLKYPSPPTHCQNLLLTLALTDWANQSLQHSGLGSHRKKKSSVSPIRVPSIRHSKRERQANLLLTFLGPQPFTKKKLNGT